MLDEPLTALGNILHMIGNLAMGITVMIFIIVLLYVLIYSKTDFFQHTAYMYKENVKKWLWIVIGGLVVTAFFHILGAWVTPDAVSQSINDYN